MHITLRLFITGALASIGWFASLHAEEKIGYVVTVELSVDETGAVESARILSSDADILNKVALTTGKKMKLKPKLANGVPVKYHAKLPVNFPVAGDGGTEAQRQASLPGNKTYIPPTYPLEMRKRGQAGGAIIEVWTTPEGTVAKTSVLRSSHPEFGEAAELAVRRWEFSPALVAGQPVGSHFFQAVVFEMDGVEFPEIQWYLAPRPCLAGFSISGRKIDPSSP